MNRAWSLSLPVVTVLVVAYSLLVAGVPRKISGARVYGGPTTGVSSLSLRVETVTRDGENESSASLGPVTVRAVPRDGIAVTASVARSDLGVADIALELEGSKGAPVSLRVNRGPVVLELTAASGAILAAGSVELDASNWAARARRRGGWIRARDLGGLVLSIAAERGAFVVGFADPLAIRVERAGTSVSGAELTVTAEGARVTAPEHLRSDARGRAHLSLEVDDLNPTVRITARTSDGQSGVLDSGVPVVPGGFHVLRKATGIRVEIAVPRSDAFFSLVGTDRRVTGGVLHLAPDGRGGSIADAEIATFPDPAWLVVSSEVDQRSSATIGWPLASSEEPAETFDVPDKLLLDGLPAAFAREQARRSRVRWLTALFIALALALSVVLLVLRVRAADRDISRHLSDNLEPEMARRVAPQRILSLLVGLLVVGLGFILLALITLARSL